MGFLKPKIKSTPTNQFAGQLNTSYSPVVDQGIQGGNILSSLLTGTGDTGAASGAFDRFKEMAGYAPALRDMQRGVVGGAAAGGLLNSGSTSKALLKKGAELDQGMFGNFLQQLSGLSGMGMNAGQLISGAGGTSQSQSPSTAAMIAKGIGGIASIFGSDRKIKHDITEVGVLSDGLPYYTFRYAEWFDPSQELRMGVMADDVAEIRPWALGPTVGGFATVNYGAL